MTTGVTMTKAAVIAHLDKKFGGGLDEFRGLLQAASPGFRTTRRPEMSKSTMARTGSADLFAESLHVLADLEAAADSALRSEALPTSNVARSSAASTHSLMPCRSRAGSMSRRPRSSRSS